MGEKLNIKCLSKVLGHQNSFSDVYWRDVHHSSKTYSHIWGFDDDDEERFMTHQS